MILGGLGVHCWCVFIQDDVLEVQDAEKGDHS